MPDTLPLVVSDGQAGHNDDHDEIHTLLQRLDGQTNFLATGLYQSLAAAQPAADSGNLGLFHFATDTDRLAYSDGAAWHKVVSEDDDAFFGSGRPWADPNNAQFAGGADNTGTADSAAAVQAAVDSQPTTGLLVVFSRGTYKIQSSIVPPTSTGTLHATFEFRGLGGATLKTTAAIAIIADGAPADQTAAVNRALRRFVIRDLRFEGTSTAGQKGVFLMGSYGSVIENCTFRVLDTGLDLVFALMHAVRNCFDASCVSYGFRARSGTGLWSGAGVVNSASNGGLYETCRSYGSTGELAQFDFSGCSGTYLLNCICEGSNPVNAIKSDYAGSTTTKPQLTVVNLHSENAPTGAIIAASLSGTLIADGIWHQGTSVFIDTSGSAGSAVVIVRCIPWVAGGTPFKITSTVSPNWFFEGGIGYLLNYDPLDPSFWVGGITPLFYAVVRMGNGTTETYGGYGLVLQAGYGLSLHGSVYMDASAATHFRAPIHTTATRQNPAVVRDGCIKVNTTTHKLELCVGSTWYDAAGVAV